MIAYCVKCRAKKEMTGATRTTTKKGQPMMKGKCSKCGTRVCKFVPKK